VEISSNKRGTPFSGNIIKVKLNNRDNISKSHSQANLEYRAKTLHFNARKLELDRIEREN
jgi:hypothetical protein